MYYTKLLSFLLTVTIETPSDKVTKSTRVEKVAFYEQLSAIGGTLGLFAGISLLSMVEVIFFCLTISKRFFLLARVFIVDWPYLFI